MHSISTKLLLSVTLALGISSCSEQSQPQSTPPPIKGSATAEEAATDNLGIIKANHPIYRLEVAANVEKQIEALTQRLIQKQVLENSDKIWFPAKFYDGDDVYSVDIRIRGDLANHWQYEKKSWRIRFPSNKPFKEYSSIDIIVPRDKGYEVEPLSYRVARSLGLLTPDSGFLNLQFNKKYLGLYFWMEKPSKGWLRRQNYPEGEVFKQANLWVQNRTTGYGMPTADLALFAGGFENDILSANDPNLKKFQGKWSNFIDFIRDSSDAEFEAGIEKYLNIEKYLSWNAITWLFGSLHSHWGDNLRWFYHSKDQLFEPLLYDVNRYKIENERTGTFEHQEFDPLALRVLKINKYRMRRNEILWKLLDEWNLSDESQKDFSKIEGDLLATDDISARAISGAHLQTVDILEFNRENLVGNLDFARAFIEPSFQLIDNGILFSVRIVPDSLSALSIPNLSITFNQMPEFDLPAGWIQISENSKDWGKKTPITAEEDHPSSTVHVKFESLQMITPVRSNLAPKAQRQEIQIFLPIASQAETTEVRLPSRFSIKIVHALSGRTLKDGEIYLSTIGQN